MGFSAKEILGGLFFILCLILLAFLFMYGFIFLGDQVETLLSLVQYPIVKIITAVLLITVCAVFLSFSKIREVGFHLSGHKERFESQKMLNKKNEHEKSG